MKKVISRGMLFVSTVVALFLVSTSAAYAADLPIDEAVASLQNGQSYDASLNQVQVDPGLNGSNVGVVVSTIDNLSNFNGSSAVAQIWNQVSSQYDTVVLLDSAGTYYVAPTDAAEAVITSLDGGKGIANLNAHADQVKEIAGSYTQTSTQADAGNSGGFDAGPVLGFGGALIGGAVIATLIVMFFRRKRNRIDPITTRAIKRDEMRHTMEELGRLTSKHAEHKYPTTRVMKSILGHLNELFSRLERKGVENQKNLAEVEYANTIEKLNKALGRDYYLDIAENNTLWDRGSERLSEVEAAARAVDEQILHNIRQVNSSKDLDFRVALEAMLRSVDQPSAQDMISQKDEKNVRRTGRRR